jgi:hypothetical protein
MRTKIRLIESHAKCRYLKKLTFKGTLRQVFHLSEAPPTCILYNILIHPGKGGGRGKLTKEKVIGPKVHNAGSKIPT